MVEKGVAVVTIFSINAASWNYGTLMRSSLMYKLTFYLPYLHSHTKTQKLHQCPKICRWTPRTLHASRCLPMRMSHASQLSPRCRHIGICWTGSRGCRIVPRHEVLSEWFCHEARWDFDGYCQEWMIFWLVGPLLTINLGQEREGVVWNECCQSMLDFSAEWSGGGGGNIISTTTCSTEPKRGNRIVW